MIYHSDCGLCRMVATQLMISSDFFADNVLSMSNVLGWKAMKS